MDLLRSRPALIAILAVAIPLTAGAQQNGQSNVRFTPGQQTDIYAFAVQSAAVITGGTKGSFTDGNGNFVETNSLNRYLSASGAADPAFKVNPDGNVFALAQYPDGRLLVAGDFTQINIAGVLTSATGIVRLKADGTLDAAFTANVTASPRIQSVVLQPDGNILIGGVFTAVDGAPRTGVARLLNTGKVDPTFDPKGGPGSTDQVVALALQGSKVLVAGDFTHFAGQGLPALVRLDSGGNIDPTFAAPLQNGSIVAALLVDANGGIVAGGSQIKYAGQPPSALLRLGPDGALDAGFLTAVAPTPVNGAPDPKYAQNPPTTPPPSLVEALLLQDDGRVLVGGLFDGVVGGVAYHNLVRLFPDGSQDPSFVLPANPNPNSQPELLAVDALALQPDGSLLVGTRVPPNYGRPIPGFPTDPLVNILINAVGLVGFRTPQFQVAPGPSTAMVAVKRSFGSTAGSLVYTTADGTALAGRDYQAATGVLSWSGGDTSDHVFPINIPAGSQGGTVNLALKNGSQGVIIYPVGANATLTIPPAPIPTPTPTPPPPPPPPPPVAGAPILTLSIEGSAKTAEGGPKLLVDVARTGDVSLPLDVLYKAKGTAVNGTNYKALSGHLTIPAGASMTAIKIKPFDDEERNPKRTVIIKLKADPNGIYTVGDPASVTVFIKDND